MNEPALLNTCHSVQVSRILKWRVARTYQADVLLKVFHSFLPFDCLYGLDANSVVLEMACDGFMGAPPLNK